MHPPLERLPEQNSIIPADFGTSASHLQEREQQVVKMGMGMEMNMVDHGQEEADEEAQISQQFAIRHYFGYIPGESKPKLG